MPEDSGDSGALHRFEFHFQEGFLGQKIDLLVEGKLRASFKAKTRFQTGLAHIEPLMLHDGEEVVIRQEGKDKAFRVDQGKPFVTLGISDGTLTIDGREQSPGYL